jgi:SNF2 family DNA or RNA helicase
MKWHDSFDRMKQRPHILVVCPQAVAPAWGRVVRAAANGEFKPWRHQLDAAEWAGKRHASMLALDMGTGKTYTALLTLKTLDRPVRVVDVSVGPSAHRAAQLEYELAHAGDKTLVVVVNYDSVWRGKLGTTIEAVRWSGIVLDESHRIKAPGGKASRWLARLAARHPHAKRLCLTGTPMPHSPLDLYGQFRFLDPSVFGTSFSKMRARYAECDFKFPSKVKKWINQDELTGKLDVHSWRVTADEVLDLPEALHETVSVELSPKARKFYETLESEMVAEVESGTVTAANALTKLLRLQQATSGYACLDRESAGDAVAPVMLDGVPAKRVAMQDRLEDLPANEPVVVFCRFRSDLDEVQRAAEALGRPYAEVSGTRKDLERWQAGEATLLGVQMQSGGVGIDLSRAAYAFYYSIGFSLGDYEQSLARLRRPGQTRCVRYYHMVAKDTVDEEVYEALSERRDVIGAVLSKLAPRSEKEAVA